MSSFISASALCNRLCCAALLVAAVGCPASSSSNTSADGGAAGSMGSTGGSTIHPCSLESASAVGAALGITGLSAPVQTVNSIVTECMYAQGSNADKASVRYEGPETPADFVMVKAGFTTNGFPATDIADLGDSAFSSTLGTGAYLTNTVVVYAKSTSVEIVSQASIAQEVAFARVIIAKL